MQPDKKTNKIGLDEGKAVAMDCSARAIMAPGQKVTAAGCKA